MNTLVSRSLARSSFKPPAHGRNIVAQQLATLLNVTCCVRLQTLLHVVESCWENFETGQTFSPEQTNATLLANNSQHSSFVN